LTLLVVEANWLERDFDEGEVLEVVKDMNGDKVSSPDGYSMTFFQACWDVLKEDVMKAFHDFHARGNFERSLDATFIALILKNFGARSFCSLSYIFLLEITIHNKMRIIYWQEC
jgi:hypothetical protein